MRSKKHHYIPRFLLKRFRNANGNLWFSVQGTSNVIEPADAFFEKNLNTLYLDVHEHGGELHFVPDDEPERDLSELEGRAAHAIDKIVDATNDYMESRSETAFSILSQGDLRAWQEFYVSMLHRTPQALDDVIRESFGEHPVSRVVQSDDEVRESWEGLPERTRRTLEQRLVHSVKAAFAASVHDDYRGGYDFGLAIAAYTNPRRNFIIGSYGVADRFWLPIAPNIATAPLDTGNRIMLTANDELLRREVNAWLARHSRFIAGHARKLVERHARIRPLNP